MMSLVEHPRVSVIIPAYNRAYCIQRAITSALSQTLPVFEIVVVDDASSDGTLEAAAGLQDERVRILRHARNMGAAASRNTAMQAVSPQSDFIAWLDSDDEWFPQKLEFQIQALQAGSPRQKASYTAYEIIIGGQTNQYFPEPVDRRRLFLGCDLSPGSTLLFERQVLDTVGYLDTSLRRYEDWDWLLRYLLHFDLVGTHHLLARIHFSPKRSASAVEASAAAFIDKYQDELSSFGWFGRQVISRRYFETSCYYLQEHNPIGAARNLSRSLLRYPFHRPGSFILLFDAWFGTDLHISLPKWKSRLKAAGQK